MRTVSIAMATYNGAAYLRQQLDSFIQQTRPPEELIIGDDGSTDGTLAILNSFQASAPFPIRVLRGDTQPLGFSRNFERLFATVRGDLILFSDQDDIWYPAKLDRMVKAFDADPSAVAAICDQAMTDEAGALTGQSYFQFLRSMQLGLESARNGCATAVRRDFLRALPSAPASVGFDVWINDLSRAIGGRVIVDEVLQIYRRHDGNTSTLVTGLSATTAENRTALWTNEIVLLDMSIAALGQVADNLPSLAQRATEGGAGVNRKRTALARRLATVAVPRWRRPLRIVPMLLRGDYAYYGRRAAIEDALL